MSMPSPLTMPKQRTEKTATPLSVTADIDAEAPAVLTTGLVRPGLVDEVTLVEHDGIIKAKHVKEGQVVRAFLHGAPRGGERTVKSVERIEGGSMVRIEFSSPHPTTDYKAAYRFFDATLVGTTVKNIAKVPALVAYEEV